MSPAAAAQLGFAAEFALFLVAVAGVACSMRPGLLSDVPWARSCLASGFLGLATASFLRGALVVPEADRPLLITLRLAAGLGIALGLLRWKGRRSTVAMVVGLVFMTGAGVALITDHIPLSDLLRSTAALCFGGALVFAARRSISARIAVDAAGLVLAVVLVVAVAVSFTVSDNVEGQAKDRYAARAASEADAAVGLARSGLGPARLASRVMATERAETLLRAAEAEPSLADQMDLASAMSSLTGLLDLDDPIVLVSPDGRPLAAAPAEVSRQVQGALAADPVVAEALDNRAERQGVTVVGGDAFALATAPVDVRLEGRPARFAGAVVVARPLDRTYLRVLGTGGERLTYALVTPDRVLARTGSKPTDSRLRGVARQVAVQGSAPRLQADDRFIAAAPVGGGNGRTIFSFVVAAPADAAEATREALFRTLFLVALGSALVAVVVAVLVGERIGRGLRQLTDAAQAMQGGALDTRVRVRSDDELGVLGGAFSSMADSINAMTAELRAAALEEATIRARLEAVITGMSEALIAVDHDGTVLELNRAAEELLDCRRDEVIGVAAPEVVAWRGRDGGRRPFVLEELVDGEPIEADLAVGEDTIPVMVTAGSLHDAGTDDAGYVLVLRDVRRERELDDLKASILANISHELRTPLTPIKGYAGMLRDRKLTLEQTRMFAGEIIGGVDQLERVVRQLVTFGTIAAGRLDIAPSPVLVADLAARVEQRWQPRMPEEHDLQVNVDLAGHDGSDVEIDLQLFDQAVDELVDNAVKYSPGGGTVKIDLTRAHDPAVGGPALRIDIADQGVGIPEDRLAELTQAFSQGDASETRRFGGLGLGLACADRIVRAHGGYLRYVSTERAGTTVSILVPMESAASEAPV